MKIEGRVWKFGDDIDTDLIIPARYLVTTEARELGSHCLEGIKDGFPGQVKKGDIIVAGKNFGSGSSREHAPLSIKGAGIAAVIAFSFARIFYRNSINIGLPIVELESVAGFKDKDLIEIDFSNGRITKLDSGEVINFKKYPYFLQGIIKAGGLMQWAVRR
ncbi:MAG: 3-isopropylmalate dehydratase small subunit [Candidatus Omnitrophica bacterium]|nr:3-isopropylmalate dehydratase small subunit [Candidatus Omnitrophota bacterium]